jgi:hypothetical protein
VSTHLHTLAATLALTAVAVGYLLVEGVPVRPGPPRPAAQAPIPRPQPLLTGRLVLDRGTDLGLTTEQRRRLEVLDQEWQQKSQAPQAAAEGAARELSQSLQQSGGKAFLPEIQRQSEAYRELSQELRELRIRYADTVTQVLTDGQRQQLQHITSLEGGSR